MPKDPALGVIKHSAISCFMNCLFPSVCIIVSEIYMPFCQLCIIFNRRCSRLPLSLLSFLSLPLPLAPPECDIVASSDADEDSVHTCPVGAMPFFPAGYLPVTCFPTACLSGRPSLPCPPSTPRKLPVTFNCIPGGQASAVCGVLCHGSIRTRAPLPARVWVAAMVASLPRVLLSPVNGVPD